jgi:hypothetical protein
MFFLGLLFSLVLAFLFFFFLYAYRDRISWTDPGVFISRQIDRFSLSNRPHRGKSVGPNEVGRSWNLLIDLDQPYQD